MKLANAIDQGSEMRESGRTTRTRLERALLACGVLYALVYAAANDLVAATWYQGYSRLSQAVSELSATGAPTKAFLTAVLPVSAGLMLAFGAGVLKAARGRRTLGVAGSLLIAHAVMMPLWLLAPMSPRQLIAAQGIRDTMHIVLTVVTVVFTISEVGFGAAAFGRWFRLYSVVTAASIFAFGALTGAQSSSMMAGQPTPWFGLTERLSIAAWLLWLAALAVRLLREGSRSAQQLPARAGPAAVSARLA